MLWTGKLERLSAPRKKFCSTNVWTQRLEKFGQKKNFDVEKKSFLFSKNAKVSKKNVFAPNCFLVTSRGGAGWQWVLEDALEAEGLGGLLYAEFRMGGSHEFQELASTVVKLFHFLVADDADK